MERIKVFFRVYGWLILALMFLYLSGGDRPVEAAVWLSPILLLRFFREVKWWKGLLFTLPPLVAIVIIANQGMTPIPMNFLIFLTVIRCAIALIPYLLDRLLNRVLPGSLKTLLFPTAAVAAEAFLASGYTGGTWGNPVYGIGNLVLLQWVSVLGIWGMMFLIYWTASVVNEVWEHRHQLGTIRRLTVIYLVMMLGIYGFGLCRIPGKRFVDKTMRVTGLTPGPEYRQVMMGIFGKIFSESRQGIFDPESSRPQITEHFETLLTESMKLADAGSELVAWSEGATFLFESDEETCLETAARSAAEHGCHLAIGVVVLKDNCQDLLAGNQPFVKNKVIFITPDGEVAWEYAKFNRAPGMERAMTIRGDSLLQFAVTPKGSVTGAICYDMDFPDHIRQSGKMRTDLFIAPSNDWPEIKNTHGRMARMRAIENGMSLIRPTSSGISIGVDPYGRIRSWVDDFESSGAPLITVLPMKSVRTLYSSLGDIWKWICAVAGVLLVGYGFVIVIMQRKK